MKRSCVDTKDSQLPIQNKNLNGLTRQLCLQTWSRYTVIWLRVAYKYVFPDIRSVLVGFFKVHCLPLSICPSCKQTNKEMK